MRRLAGHVFDTYDDLDGQVLKTVIGSPDRIPDMVKTAARLTPEQIDRLPDDSFALIMLDEGRKLKKYATVDQGNTEMSVLYLLKQAHLLPPTAVKVAASNLIAACIHHGIEVPETLKIAAKTGTSPVSGKSQTPYARNAKVSKVQFESGTNGPKESTDNPQLGHTDIANDDVAQRTNMNGVPGTNFLKIPPFPEKEHEKTANLMPAGTTPTPSDASIAPTIGSAGKGSPMKPSMAPAAPKLASQDEVEFRTKQKSWRETPYVDMSGWDPSAASQVKNEPGQQTLLEGSYHIDGYDQVKTASAYFVENWKEFHPRKRHEYCVKLAARMEELGQDIPEDVARYGSTTYAADCDSYVESRRGWVHDEFKPALETLLEKRAQVSPDTFAEALAEFDNLSGLRWHWDAQIPDPWRSTFGPSLEKLAADEWTWDEDGVRIHEEDLKHLALNGGELLQKTFGPHFLRDFQKSPKSVFNSLPRPNKLILARAAMDRHAGTGTE